MIAQVNGKIFLKKIKRKIKKIYNSFIKYYPMLTFWVVSVIIIITSMIYTNNSSKRYWEEYYNTPILYEKKNIQPIKDQNDFLKLEKLSSEILARFSEEKVICTQLITNKTRIEVTLKYPNLEEQYKKRNKNLEEQVIELYNKIEELSLENFPDTPISIFVESDGEVDIIYFIVEEGRVVCTCHDKQIKFM